MLHGDSATLTPMSTRSTRNLVTQFSIVDALLAGLFDGTVTKKEVNAHGDFGLGCGEHMDGELVVLDGVHRLFRGDGSVAVLGEEDRIAFAEVARFEPDHVVPVAGLASLDALLAAVRALVPSPNVIVGMRLRAGVKALVLRQLTAQTKPYQAFEEVKDDQREVHVEEVEGTLLGFIGPHFFQGVTAAGLHTHFVDTTGAVGGHVLAASGITGELAVQQYGGMTVHLPESTDLLDAKLDGATEGTSAMRAVDTEDPH